MLEKLKHPLKRISNKLRRRRPPIELMKEKWTADFSKSGISCFNIKSEISGNAYLENGALFLGLKKNSRAARIETADRVYVDQVIDARFRLDGGGRCAAGIMFRVMEPGSYYVFLVSCEGYFTVEAVNGGVPVTLAGWIEAPAAGGTTWLRVIARGDHLVFVLNGKWAAEVNDASVPGGHLGFALVSRDKGGTAAAEIPVETAAGGSGDGYSCQAWLDFLSVDSRPAVVEKEYHKWNNGAEIGIAMESRFRLAENYAALGRYGAAYDQILRAWKQREEAARSVMATYTEMRTRTELVFAAGMALKNGQVETAEEYIDICLAMGPHGAEKPDVLAEKAIILSIQNKFEELAAFLPFCIERMNAAGEREGLPPLYAMLGHACWNIRNYSAAAAAWDKAFEIDPSNGLYAVNAADAWETLGKNGEALRRRIDGGNCFLLGRNSEELDTLVPKLLECGKKSWEARTITGKWAYDAGDYALAETELAAADKLRRKARPVPGADHAVCFIRGDLLNRRGKSVEALAFFSEAAELSPNDGLYRFRLAETRYRVGSNPHDPLLAADIEAALRLIPGNRELLDFAAVVKQAADSVSAVKKPAGKRDKKNGTKPETAVKPVVKKSGKKSSIVTDTKPAAAAEKEIAAETEPVSTATPVPEPAASESSAPETAKKTRRKQ